MDFQIKLGRICESALITVILAAIAPIGFAQPAAISAEKPSSANEANTSAALTLPYIAEITGNDVFIRSGSGTNFYDCGKLYRGDKVEVVRTQFGWSCIVPPAGSFSWISMQYVSVNRDNPNIGIVTGDVGVYAGSEEVKPMHSTSEQVKLKRGQTIKLLGEEKEDYYKIAPPSGAYLWVSTQFTQPVSTVTEGFELSSISTTATTVPGADVNTIAPTAESVEAEKLKEFYTLQEKLKTERTKPIDEQNYAETKKVLKDIAGNKAAGKAARYAEIVIKQIEGCELAIQVTNEVKLQNIQLQKVLEEIDKAHAARIAKVENLGRFIIIGKFQTFETYGPGHYRIVDDSDKTKCYALPSETLPETYLSQFIGKKVGLVGTTEPHPQTAGALVRFSEIVDL